MILELSLSVYGELLNLNEQFDYLLCLFGGFKLELSFDLVLIFSFCS